MRSIHFNKQGATGMLPNHLVVSTPLKADEIYRQLQISYPKFFKMDPLCRWAFIGAELLCGHGDNAIYKDLTPENIGVVLATGNACIDVDHLYQESMREVASPGLFVYTLPNIMLGEISIRHGFKGEQLCLIQEEFDRKEIEFAATDLIQHRGMEACVYGWVNVKDGAPEVDLFWATKVVLPS